MGVSLVIYLMVQTQNGGSLVMSSIGCKTNIFDSPDNPSGSLTVKFSYFTHLVVHQKKTVYTPMGGWPTINVMIYTHF